MDQGQEPKFPLLVYVHPQDLIKPWPREERKVDFASLRRPQWTLSSKTGLRPLRVPPLYEKQNYGKKHIYNISYMIGLYAIFGSQRAYGEHLGFNDTWEAAFVGHGGIARQDLGLGTISCESASTQRAAFCAATPRTKADTARSKIEIARLKERFVLDTTFNSNRY